MARHAHAVPTIQAPAMPLDTAATRRAFAVHCVDANAAHPADNWLQRDPAFPARRFR